MSPKWLPKVVRQKFKNALISVMAAMGSYIRNNSYVSKMVAESCTKKFKDALISLMADMGSYLRNNSYVSKMVAESCTTKV